MRRPTLPASGGPLALSVLALLLASPCACSPAPTSEPLPPPALEPRVSPVDSEWEWDAGLVRAGTRLQHTFRFENASDAPLEVTKVAKDCSCHEHTVSRGWLAPGEVGSIAVAVDAHTRSDRLVAEFHVIGHCQGGEPTYLGTFVLEAEIFGRTSVTIDPPVLALGTITSLPALEFDLVLRGEFQSPDTLLLQAATFDNREVELETLEPPALQVAQQPGRAAGAQPTVRRHLRATLPGGLPPAPLADYGLRLTVSDELGRPTHCARLMLTGELCAADLAWDHYLFLGSISAGSASGAPCPLPPELADPPLELEASQVSWVRASLVPASSGPGRGLSLSFGPEAPRGPFEEEIRLRTQSGLAGRLTIAGRIR